MGKTNKPAGNILDELFIRLNKKKILANQNFACCQNCGVADSIKVISQNPDLIGYCFYHDQDRESAAENGELYLTFGDCYTSDFTDEEIGKIIYNTCRKLQFKTRWNGSTSDRIKIYLPENVINKLKNDIEMENEMFCNCNSEYESD